MADIDLKNLQSLNLSEIERRAHELRAKAFQAGFQNLKFGLQRLLAKIALPAVPANLDAHIEVLG